MIDGDVKKWYALTDLYNTQISVCTTNAYFTLRCNFTMATYVKLIWDFLQCSTAVNLNI